MYFSQGLDRIASNINELEENMATNLLLLDTVIAALIAGNKARDRDDALNHIASIHDKSCGLFHFAKEYNALVENSACELSIQFYTAFNEEIYPKY